MKRIVTALSAIVAALSALLSGCTSDASQPHPTDLYLAMARGEVMVSGGLVKISARQTGHLVTADVRIGQRVQAGETLATLDSGALRTALLLAQSDMIMAQARQTSSRLKREAAARALSRLQAAQAADAAPAQAVEDAQTDLTEQIALEKIAGAEAAAAQARHDAALQALADTQVRAPVNGELIQVNAAAFQLVAANDTTPLFVLLPDRPRLIHAELDEEFANVLHNGMKAEIVLNDAARTVIRATTVSIANSVHLRESAATGAEHDESRVIDCEIGVDAPTLRVGQQVIVRFLKGAP